MFGDIGSHDRHSHLDKNSEDAWVINGDSNDLAANAEFIGSIIVGKSRLRAWG